MISQPRKLKRPNLNNDLLKNLVKFRFYRVALTVDIKRAFLQISVNLEDRDAMRVLLFECTPIPREQHPPI